MIVAVAIERNGLIFSMPKPARHHHVLNHMDQKEKIDALDVEQDFLTNDGEFVDRRTAAGIAVRAGQILEPQWPPELYSEDLW